MLTALKTLRVVSGVAFAVFVYLNVMNYVNGLPTDPTYAVITGVVFCVSPSVINWYNIYKRKRIERS